MRNGVASEGSPALEPEAEQGAAVALRKLLPLLVAMYVIAYVDRINITFAEDQLESDLALSGSAFGLAAGIFFLGYALFEVPSNLILVKVGSRVWLARIMISWGVLAAANALAWNAASLSGLRFLLGVAEAGFFPGALYYLSQWFPSARRGTAIAIFYSGLAIASVISGPLSGALLELDGVLGLAGWRWMFLVEGAPAVLIGLYVLRRLPERPTDARWMPQAQGRALERAVAREASESTVFQHATLRTVFTDRRVVILVAVYFCVNMASVGVTYWLADIIERAGDFRDLTVGLIAAVPLSCSAIGLFVFGRRADRSVDRRRPVLLALAMTAAGLAATALLPAWPAMLALCVAAFAVLGVLVAFWSLCTSLLAGHAAAAGIAYVNSIGLLGGLAGPVVVGALKDSSGSLTPGLLALTGVLVIGLALLTRLRLAAPARVAVTPV